MLECNTRRSQVIPNIDILDLIWSFSEGRYVFMPTKYFGRWQERAPLSEIVPSNIRSQLRDEVGYDSYFSVAKFTDVRRVEANVGSTGVLYADLDTVAPDGIPAAIRPSIAWETSPGSYQAVWFVDGALTPLGHKVLNRSLSAYVGADMGSWIPTKVLRVPGTLNWKRRSGITPVRGRILWVELRVFYAEDMQAYLPTTESQRIITEALVPPLDKQDELRHKHWGTLSLRLRSLVSRKVVKDRSAHIRMTAKQFAREGFPAPVAFSFIEPRPWNKWSAVPDKLMAQIGDAYASI